MVEPMDPAAGKDEIRRAWESQPQHEKIVYLYEWNHLLTRWVDDLGARVAELERLVNQAATKD